MTVRYDAERQCWTDDAVGPANPEGHARSEARQRQAVRGLLVVLAVTGVAFGTWALGWRDEPEPPPPPPPDATATVTAPPADGASPSGQDGEASGQSSPAAVPDGFTRVTDPAGFSVAVPEGWERRSTGGETGTEVVFYETDGGAEQVQLFWVEDPDPYTSLELAEKNAERNDAYERLSLARDDSGDSEAAQLEYTYHSADQGGSRHVVDHRFRAADGQLYAILAIGPWEDGGTAEKERLRAALTTFCPEGASCDADTS